jgi:NADH dehydrogenase (ubiquinone) 1 beta subcomplex subunit 8
MSFQAYRRAPSLLKRLRLASSYATNSIPANLQSHLPDDPQIADYPRLPWVSRQRLPARGWWDPQMRRNFGDTVHFLSIPNFAGTRIQLTSLSQYHEQEEILGMWGPDAHSLPPNIAVRWFSIAVVGFVSFGVITKLFLIPSRPAVAREYPYSGLITELGGLEENQVCLLIWSSPLIPSEDSTSHFILLRPDRKVIKKLSKTESHGDGPLTVFRTPFVV